mmetsp:Transcript_42101/g.100626  ORF Transcript_42101/g.100626 Transcript_42101/m.100626 type:complete len:607 (+) Transcript_42101:87-1907(+)
MPTCTDCSCFSGLRRQMRRRRPAAGSLQEALKIGRRHEGKWKPSKQALRPLPQTWASPVPRLRNERLDTGDSVELICEDLDSDAPNPLRMRPEAGEVLAQRPRLNSRFEVEQLLASPGSLPPPLPAEKREAIIRALAPTATFEMLARVPRPLLEEQSTEMQELRRKLTQGATLVFVSAGYPGKRFIFERAAAMGVKSVIVDHPDSWSRSLVQEGIIAKFLPVDMSQSSDEVYRQSESLIRQLGSDGVTGPADGITTFVELSVPLAARLCEAFGLPGYRPEAVDAARDKHRTRAALKAAGLPTPRNALIRNEAELETQGRAVGFPAVLKPVSGAASLGVKKVTSMDDLHACYREVVSELKSLVVSSGALVKADPSGQGVNASSVVDLTVLLEQYLDGQEVDVDIVMSEGEWRYAAISDNGPTLEPYFNETWGICPSLLTRQQQSELKELSVNCVKTLGFSSGVFHVECKYTSTGPQLIEVNARMGGGPIRETNRVVWGVDLVEEAIFIALGIPARPPAPMVPFTAVGYSMYNARRSGRLVSTECFEAMRSRQGVLSADPLVQAGAAVVGPTEGLPTWLCMLVVSKASPKEALDYILALEDELDVPIE